MPLKLNGSTSGYVQLDAPAIAGTTAITVPAISGTLIVADSSGNVGIGTSASYKLQVTGGSIYQSQSDASMSRIGLSNTNRHWTISNYGTSYGPNGSFNIADETAASVRFQIDTSGRVNMPYQPAFYASGASSNYTLTNGADLPFNRIIYNIGPHFNSSTYRFTAPVAGRYLFTWSVFNNGSPVGRCTIKVNNAGYNDLQMDVGAAMSQSAILNLNANDFVSVGDWQSFSGGVFYMGHSHFSGILLG
jgi:hypothetical protein